MPPRPIDLDTEALAMMYRGGMTLAEIAAVLDCGMVTVWRRLKALRVPRRRPGKVRGVRHAA